MSKTKKIENIEQEITRLKEENTKLLVINEFVLYADTYLTSPYLFVVYQDDAWCAGRISYIFNFNKELTAKEWVYDRLQNNFGKALCIYEAKDKEAADKHNYTLVWRDNAWTAGAQCFKVN